MKAVILAAGEGKRMRGLCKSIPKPLLPIANRPILGLAFSRLKMMGVDEVALVVGHRREQLEQLVGTGRQYGVNVTYILQEKQLGTGHATMLCEEFVGKEPFVLIFGDIITREENYPAMAQLFESGTCDAILSVFPVEDPSNGAAVDVQDGFVRGIVEKPKPGTMLNAYNNAGIFIWPAEIFDHIRNLKLSSRGEYEFTDGIISFMNAGKRLAAFELMGYWDNITDPESCIRMNQNLLDDILPPARSETHWTARISDRAQITNSVIGSGCEISTGARLDGCITGQNVKVGQNVIAEYTEILDGAVISGGCQLGPNVSIGPGALIEPMARIGPNTTIGAGCFVGAGATVSSSILLPGSKVAAGGNVIHAMLEGESMVAPGERANGTPERAVEVLRKQVET